MKLRFAVLIACAGMALVTETSRGADIEREKEMLLGTWKSVSYEGVGIEKNSDSLTLIIKDDQITLVTNEWTIGGIYELDVDEDPKWFDITHMHGLNKSKVPNRGIYRIEGDTLTICRGGSNRPNKLTLRPDSIDTLIVLKRKQK